MSAEFYNQMAGVARDLISRFGQEVKIIRASQASQPDPVTGATQPGDVLEFYPQGVFRTYPANLIDGTRIKAGDREIILDDTERPRMTDKIEVDDEHWPIVDIQTAEPAGIPLVYFVQVRR